MKKRLETKTEKLATYTKSKSTNFSQTISFFTMPKKIIKRKLLFACRIYSKRPSIFSRLGAWQFLADMPFRSVSSETLWKLFLVLHLDASKVDSVESIQRENAYKDNWRDILKSMFNNTSNKLWATVLQAHFQALPS